MNTKKPSPERFMTAEEAAKFLGFKSRNTAVYYALQHGWATMRRGKAKFYAERDVQRTKEILNGP